MTNLINAAFFIDARNAMAEFNSGVDTYNNALDALREAATDLESAKESLETELQCARDALEAALATIKTAQDNLPDEISEPGDCDDQSEIEIDFDAIETN